ncbi:MAG: hypothetical protein EAZ27_09940 [Cytophagales bacterium]|nr:MAG: hypothetical protein EAZ27_09940 [Cytophagales bacterium]
MKSSVKFLYYISILFFFFTLLFAYYQLPDYVPIGINLKDKLKEFKSKSFLFYWSVGLFFVINVWIIVLKIIIKMVPFSLLPFPNKKFWMSSSDHREGLVNAHLVWFNSFATIFNVFLGALSIIMVLVNVLEYGSFDRYEIIVYSFMFLISFWWVVLVGRLFINKIEL